jgi:hypothetical protein
MWTRLRALRWVPDSAPALLVSSVTLSSIDTLDSFLLDTHDVWLNRGGSSLLTLSFSHHRPSANSPPCSSLGARYNPCSTRVVFCTFFRRHPRPIPHWDSFVVAPWWFRSAYAAISSLSCSTTHSTPWHPLPVRLVPRQDYLDTRVPLLPLSSLHYYALKKIYISPS